ncbi:carbohydrate esterase family 4 protein, partial [Mucor lusitanicus CBS 277.49]
CDWTFTGCFGKEDLYECPKGQWALTYDDGPSEFSPKLYDYLDKVNVKATFFMVGGQVVQFPDYALRAYKSGHELAMHTWSHNYMTTLTNEQIVAELKWNELVIKEVTGVAPRYFRPPYGDIDNRVRDVAAALGFAPIIWNHDTNDWAYASNPKVFKESWIDGNVTKWANAAKSATVGGISLEHDLYTQTVDAAIRILPILQKEYELVP